MRPSFRARHWLLRDIRSTRGVVLSLLGVATSQERGVYDLLSSMMHVCLSVEMSVYSVVLLHSVDIFTVAASARCPLARCYTSSPLEIVYIR